MAQARSHAAFAGNVVRAVGTGAWLEGQVAPVAVFCGTSDAFVFQARDTFVVGLAPAALGVGEAVEAVLVLGAGAVGVGFEVFESEHLKEKSVSSILLKLKMEYKGG
mgnify:FL=1